MSVFKKNIAICACGFLILLLAFGILLYEKSSPLETLSTIDSFTLTGSFKGGTSYTAMTPPPDQAVYRNIKLFGSWISEENHIGTLESEVIKLEPPLKFGLLISGNPNKSGNYISILNIKKNENLNIQLNPNPDTKWNKYLFTLPNEWSGDNFKILAKAESTGPGNWVGLSEPFISNSIFSTESSYALSIVILKLLTLLLLLLLNNIYFAVLCESVVGIKGNSLIIGFSFVFLYLYAVFWIFIYDKNFGEIFTASSQILLFFYLIYFSLKNNKKFLEILSEVTLPYTIFGLYTLIALSLGLVYGFDDILSTANHRYFHWTADNELPLVYANKILGEPQHPIWDSWNVLTRPPLQTAFFLPIGTLFPDRSTYQVVGSLLQGSVILGLWGLIRSLPISLNAKKYTLSIVIFSPFILANTFFVWPKLLATTFIFFLITIIIENWPSRVWKELLIGICAGLAMLSHGGSFFPLSFLTILIAISFLKTKVRNLNLKKFFLISFVFLTVVSPWIIYSNMLGDPNEQIRWHLGGTLLQTSNHKNTLTTIFDGYKKLPLNEIIDNKISNLSFQLTSNPNSPQPKNKTETGNGESLSKKIIDSLMTSTFWNLAPFIIPVIVGTTLYRIRRSAPPIPRALYKLLGAGFCLTIYWCIMMFGPNLAYGGGSGANASAVLFQSSFFTPILLITISAAMIASLDINAARIALITQLVLFLLVGFIPTSAIDPGMIQENRPLSFVMVAYFITGMTGLLAFLNKPNIYINYRQSPAIEKISGQKP